GDAVALMSENRPEWPICDFAVQSLGAVTVPVYPTLEAGQVAHIVEDSGAKVAVVESESLRVRVESARERTPELGSIVVMEHEGEGLSFEEVEREGAQSPVSGWEDGWRAIGREDVATIIYTSGTTGLPKGVLLTQGNLLSNLEGIMEALPVSEDDIMLSLLPLSHVFERTAGQYLAFAAGSTTYYAESIDKVPDNLREIRPNVTISVPRLYEKMYDRVLQSVTEGGGLKKKMFEDAVECGKRAYEIERDGGTVGGLLKLRLKLYDRLIFAKLREAVGGRLDYFVSGGARLNPEIGKLFHAAGVKILEGYGLTETSPVIACNRLERIRFGTVGPPLHNLEVKIDESGEVLVKGPSVMRGYLNNEKANAEAFTEDGFYRTGDVGEIDEAGYLKITDRAKNLMVLSTGKNVAPQPVETALTAAPHITQAVLVGDGRKYVSALIVPDYDAVRRTLGVEDANESLAAEESVRALIEADSQAATAGFAAYERPKRFVLLARELSQERGELTPTLKVKMNAVQERYGDQVESLYA
ncbi:MAG: long-chain fatty acid--CoA ligase, partial [Rubrobacter sp.]|nr:long-chain fatty acid--CoA ligase [Rubrobacter sp.]